MKRIMALLAAVLLLTACAARQTGEREEALRARYAALTDCTARVEASVVREGETRSYTLDVRRAGEETRVTVLAPEALAGIAAVLRGDDLALAFDGMVLDAGSADEDVSAVNAVSIFLRAAAGGCVTERSTERFDDAGEALRLCFESEQAGSPLYVTAYFDAADVPLYAEIERNGEILVYLRFTDFVFGDILPEEQGAADDPAWPVRSHAPGASAAAPREESEGPFYGDPPQTDLG